ncbi:MAG: SIMPL domain-containing protein [Bacteroidales bacterium]
MKSLKISTVSLIISCFTFMSSLKAQEKNFLDRAYMETTISIDTMVNIDKITISITLNEEDMKGSQSVEAQEDKLTQALKSLDIDTNKELKVDNMSSDIESGFLKGRNVVKSKSYLLELSSPKKAFQTMLVCEELGVSKFKIVKTEVSNIKEIELELKKRALVKAKYECTEILSAVGEQLGAVLKINIMNTNSFAPMYSDSMLSLGLVRAKVNENVNNVQDLNFKQMKVSTTISVIFAI